MTTRGAHIQLTIIPRKEWRNGKVAESGHLKVFEHKLTRDCRKLVTELADLGKERVNRKAKSQST